MPTPEEETRLAVLARKLRRRAREHGRAPTDADLRHEEARAQADAETLAAMHHALRTYAGTGLENL